MFKISFKKLIELWTIMELFTYNSLKLRKKN